MDIEKVKQAVEAVERLGSQVAAAKELGIARSSLQNRLKKAALSGNDNLAFKPVPFGHSVKGTSTYYDADGVPRGQWVKTRTDQIAIEDLVEYFRDAFAEFNGKSFPFTPQEVQEKNLLTVYPIADLHIGLLSWNKETGRDWDMNIAKDVILNTMAKLVSQSRPTEKAIIANLGDYFHVNDSKNVTPASKHLLDVDSRLQKIIYVGVNIMISMIDMALQKHNQVVVRNVKGNHDEDSCVALNVALHLWYSNNPRVTIEDSPAQFWYTRHGTTLLGFYHGHTCPPERAAMTMACENAEEWGKSVYRMMLHGHIHQEKVKEVGNVRVESFQTIAAKDAYAASHAYTSGRSLTAITIHDVFGEIGRHRVNL